MVLWFVLFFIQQFNYIEDFWINIKNHKTCLNPYILKFLLRNVFVYDSLNETIKSLMKNNLYINALPYVTFLD